MKVGIIGCGRITVTRHAPEYAACKGAEIAGFYDKNPARAKELAQQYGSRVFLSEKELIKDAGIDAVSVCLPNALHAEVSIAALSSGKHVLCEKPMAHTFEDCKRMVLAANRAKRALMIGFNQRFDKAHLKAKALLAGGVIGKPLTFACCFGHSGPDNWSVDKGTGNWFFDKEKSGRGALFDLGVHKTDLIQYLLGENAAAVKAYTAALDKRTPAGDLIPVEDNALCLLRMPSGAAGTVASSWTYYGKSDNTTVIHGSKGTMIIEPCPVCRVTVYTADKQKTVWRPAKNKNSGLIEAFVKAVNAHTAPPSSGEEALAAMRTVFAAAKSADSGKEEKTGN